MKLIEYTNKPHGPGPDFVVLSTEYFSVLESEVLVKPPVPNLHDPLPAAAAKPFIDAFLKKNNLPVRPYSARIETWPDAHQPWPVFVFQEFGSGDCVAEFYPKNFESQTIAVKCQIC